MNDLFAALAGYGRGRLERQDRRIAEDQRQFQNDLQQEAMDLQKRQYDEAQRQYDASLAQASKFHAEEMEQMGLEREDRKLMGMQTLMLQRDVATQNAWAEAQRVMQGWSGLSIQGRLASAEILRSTANYWLTTMQADAQWWDNQFASSTFRDRASAVSIDRMMKEKQAFQFDLMAPILIATAQARQRIEEGAADQTEFDLGKAQDIWEATKGSLKFIAPMAAIEYLQASENLEGSKLENAKRSIINRYLPGGLEAQNAAAWKELDNLDSMIRGRDLQSDVIQGMTEVPKQLSWIAKKFGNDTGAVRAAILDASAGKRAIQAEAATLLGGVLPGLEGVMAERASLSKDEWSALVHGGELVDENGKRHKIAKNPAAAELLNDVQLAEQTMTELTQYLSYLGGTVGEATFPGTLSMQVFPDKPGQQTPASPAAKPSGQRRPVGTQGAGPIPFGFNQGQGPMVPLLDEPPDWLKSRIPGFPQ